MIYCQEHDRLPVSSPDAKYDRLKLAQWCRPARSRDFGYYASYRIGAEWIDENEALIVTTKRRMEHIDFLRMFMSCFTFEQGAESFSSIYSIEEEQPLIKAPVFKGTVSQLIVIHFLSVVRRIKSLKKGYVHRCENLKKVKGHIHPLKNEMANVMPRRLDRICCNYMEYSEDIPENRLIKKALLLSEQLLYRFRTPAILDLTIKKSLALFQNVSANTTISESDRSKKHKLFREYHEAVRLARTILRHFDFTISKPHNEEDKVPPFVIDMARLYEHYVYGLLHEAYGKQIIYQYRGSTGIPDFLFRSEQFKAILDTKYIPKYKDEALDKEVIRQLSGYGRDLSILKELGYNDIHENSPTPSLPCIIIYPTEEKNAGNPFKGNSLESMCTHQEPHMSLFFKIEIPIPTIITY